MVNHYMDFIFNKTRHLFPASIDFRDLSLRILLCVIILMIFYFLQGFEGKQRKIMRDFLSSYKYSGLMAFKSVWDELDRGSENPHGIRKAKLPRIKEYAGWAALTGILAALSFFRKLDIQTAVITGTIVPFLVYPVQLHFILRWFYNNKPYPVIRNDIVNFISMILFCASFSISFTCCLNLYRHIIIHYQLIKYLALGLFMLYILACLLVSGNLLKKETEELPFYRKLDLPLLAFMYIIPIAVILSLLFIKALYSMPSIIGTFFHKFIYIPEIFFPLACLASIMAWTASNSYLGKPVNTDHIKSKFINDNNSVPAREKSFLGEE